MWTERSAGMAVTAEIHSDIAEGLAWTVETDTAVLERIDHDGCFHSPYQGRAWLDAWVELRGGAEAAGLRLAVAWRGGRPVIAAPFQVVRVGGLRIARIAAAEFSDYADPAVDRRLREALPPAGLTGIWIKAARLLTGVDAICLRKLVDDPRLLSGAGDVGLVQAEPEGGHYTVLNGAWDRIGDRYFPKSTRQKLARKQRALAAEGPVLCREAANVADRLALLEQMFRWKADQLSHLGASNPFLHGPLTDFLRRFATRAGAGECRVFALEAGGRPLAVTVLCCTPGIWGQYQTAYSDGPEAKHSPGQILQHHIMQQAAAGGAAVYDFGYGDETYKERYCERHVALYRMDKAITLADRAYVLTSRAKAQAVMLLKKDRRLRPLALAASRLAARLTPQGRKAQR